MRLVNPTDRELDAAFAEKVCGWMRGEAGRGEKRVKAYYLYSPSYNEYRPLDAPYAVIWKDGTVGGDLKRFTTSADAVLPWASKEGIWQCEFLGASLYRFIHWGKMGEHRGEGDTFARAAVLALLRAHGVTVEFTA
jgi:hypothetical protein